MLILGTSYNCDNLRADFRCDGGVRCSFVLVPEDTFTGERDGLERSFALVLSAEGDLCTSIFCNDSETFLDDFAAKKNIQF